MLSIALPGQFRGTSLMLALKRSTTTFALDGHKRKEERYQLTAFKRRWNACRASKANLSPMLIAERITWDALLPYLLTERNNAK